MIKENKKRRRATKRFSEIFGIDLDQSQLDFVDIYPEKDMPLFLDPYAISFKEDLWSQKCHLHITNFFETALNHIRNGNIYEARAILNGLSEPNETCLGISRGSPKGKGVSGKQALDLYNSLIHSQAAKTGLLSELADCDLFIPGIGRDKISDITTNILIKPLIEYTLEQCTLHGILLEGNHPIDRYWDINERSWLSCYSPLPTVNKKKIILVPKFAVRRTLTLNPQEYYTHHVLNFIREEELVNNSSLVRTLRKGTRVVYKKDIKDKFPFSKNFIAGFSEANPDVLKKYKELHTKLGAANGALSNHDFDEAFEEELFCEVLIEQLKKIKTGTENASGYHKFMVGTLEFIFYPSLTMPKKEQEISNGRKRIDIVFNNSAKEGFFFRAHTSHQIASNLIMIECKNYTHDLKNPELDQLSGRFSTNRGKLGILVYRNVSSYSRLRQMCKDTASDGRGFIIPLGDDQIIEFLKLIKIGRRLDIDKKLEDTFCNLIC
ncbi:MAG: hypothetical protein ACOH2E_03320 [Candidatus Paracaedibacter sp.]